MQFNNIETEEVGQQQSQETTKEASATVRIQVKITAQKLTRTVGHKNRWDRINIIYARNGFFSFPSFCVHSSSEKCIKIEP